MVLVLTSLFAAFIISFIVLFFGAALIAGLGFIASLIILPFALLARLLGGK